MPWKESTAMSQRRELLELVRTGSLPVTTLAARFGVSRKTLYKWLARVRAQPDAGLADRSRRPGTSPGRTAAALEEQVLALRRTHPAWGGRKLRARLRALGQEAPAASTITAILRRHGLLEEPGSGSGAGPWQRFEHARPNDLWQMDFKGHVALDDGGRGGRCHPLTVLDDHSRYALVLCACATEDTATVQAALTAAFRRYGLPRRVLCDNGPPWGEPHLGPWTRLTVWLLKLGVRTSHGRAGHPQTQGKDERFHRTLVAELLGRRAPEPDLPRYQACFDAWREVYNHERPHEALDLAVPAARYQPSPRAFPERLPGVEYPAGDVVRVVRRGGYVQYRGVVWSVGGAFVGEPVALRPTLTDGVWALWFAGVLIGELDERQVVRKSRPLGRVAAPVGLRPPCAATLPSGGK